MGKLLSHAMWFFNDCNLYFENKWEEVVSVCFEEENVKKNICQ